MTLVKKPALIHSVEEEQGHFRLGREGLRDRSPFDPLLTGLELSMADREGGGEVRGQQPHSPHSVPRAVTAVGEGLRHTSFHNIISSLLLALGHTPHPQLQGRARWLLPVLCAERDG